MELLAPAPPAERASAADRFEQELGRESERISSSDDEPTHDARAPVQEREAEPEVADEPRADADDDAESDGDDELAALEQLLLVVAGAPPQTPTPTPTSAPSGGDATIASEGAVVVGATNATNAPLAPIDTAPSGNGATSATTTSGPAIDALTDATEGDAAANPALVDTSGEATTDEGAGEGEATSAESAGAAAGSAVARTATDDAARPFERLIDGATRSTNDATALDASAPSGSASLDPALAERFARELADARPLAASALTATTATPESSAPASVARATATLAQLPALLDDAVVALQRRDGRWEAEIRLDPPELGVVNVRLELEGGHLRVVARCDDRSGEQQLGQLFREWDQDLRKQGGEAFFDLERRAKDKERDATQARGERSLPAARAARSGGGVGPGAGLRIDLLA